MKNGTFSVNFSGFLQRFPSHFEFFLNQNSSEDSHIFSGLSLNLSQSFGHHITPKKLNGDQMLGADRKNSLKKRGFRHVMWPMVNKCWPTVNICWLFWKFDALLFNLHSALFPDSKFCLDQNLWWFEFFSFFKVQKILNFARPALAPKG